MARTNGSRGEEHESRIRRASRQLTAMPVDGARDLPIVHGISVRGVFSAPQENVLLEVTEIFVNSERVFKYNDTLVFESRAEPGRSLITIAKEHEATQNASSNLSNLLICESSPRDDERPPAQYPLPRSVISLVAAGEVCLARLPTIQHYATRPAYDCNLDLRTAGWHPDVGFLVHSEMSVEVDDTNHHPGIPPRLDALLQGFLFRDHASRVNAIAFLLTGLLVEYFIRLGKPIAVVDGNQPGVGKTLLARLIGILLDGKEPRLIPYTAENTELEKRICANIQDSGSSIICIDNAKHVSTGEISSVAIEANSTAYEVSLRRLGFSENVVRRNTFLWVLTMNCTRLSRDLVSRAVPIQLELHGDASAHSFASDPLKIAMQQRSEILAELIGMVEHWTKCGRPRGNQDHRFGEWAAVISGILIVNGIDGFLANQAEAVAAFDADREELVALCEFAINDRSLFIDIFAVQQGGQSGFIASELIGLFQRAAVCEVTLNARTNQRGKSQIVSRFLNRHLGTRIQVDTDSFVGTAWLVRQEGRSRQMRYWFATEPKEAPPDV